METFVRGGKEHGGLNSNHEVREKMRSDRHFSQLYKSKQMRYNIQWTFIMC